MRVHPIIYYPKRWIAVIAFTLILSILYTILISSVYNLSFIASFIDCISSAFLLLLLAYPQWYLLSFLNGHITNAVTITIDVLLWTVGCLLINDMVIELTSLQYIDFIKTVPIRVLFGYTVFALILLWYKKENHKEENDNINIQRGDEVLLEDETPKEDVIETISVKSKNKISIIKIEDIIYITACGDYVSIITKDGEFIKEQTMKYFQMHLPSQYFLRIHRSTIVNVMHISGLELYGKESYSLLMKDGKSLKISLSGYKRLKDRLKL